jgi:Spy/CpxP family protein refolding chaperone
MKALSPEQVAAYTAGEGMGYARAAELNQYPGPKHVLELAAELKLTEPQAARIREIHSRMREEAVRLGHAIVEKERALDRLFADRSVTSGSLSRATSEIARLEGDLRATHLEAHLKTRVVLTPAQITAYDELRGYGKGGHTGHAHGSGP